ncbi:hypothetical protein [Nonomuraea sp. 10N515B]
MQSIARFCGQCSCGCPELFVDRDAPEERQAKSRSLDSLALVH